MLRGELSSYPSYYVFISIVISVVITLVLMPVWKRFVKKSHIGQQVRIDGPQTHLLKQGTPTMGGVIMILAMILTSVIIGVWSPDVLGLLWAIIAAGLIGFIDDVAKVVFKRSLGLNAISKLILQFLVATLFLLYAVNVVKISPVIQIPFVVDIDLGIFTSYFDVFGGIRIPWLYIIVIDILLVGMCNAINLTDGLDGLAAGCCVVVMLIMAAIAYRTNSLGASIFSGSLAGACIGFLWYNTYPADIFMGDTGSLSLGMALGCLSVLTKTEFLCLIIGGLFVIETFSVFLQVVYYKKTKKRIFLMAPLHHHFEKKGWSETKVVIRFWIISGGFASLGFAIFFAQSLIQHAGIS